MLLTGKQLVPLRCRTRPCQHNFPIPRVQLAFSPKSPFGFEVRKFVESSRQSVCIVYCRLGSCVGSLPPAPRRSTCPTSAATSTQWRSSSPPPGSTTETSRHPGRPGLARCRPADCITLSSCKLNISQVTVTLDSIKRVGGPVVRIDQEGRVIMSKDHEQTLHNIVRAVGKNKWEDTSQVHNPR